MYEVLLVVLGSVLALATSLVVEIWKTWHMKKSLMRNFVTVLKLELKHFITIIDKLSEYYSSKNFFPFGGIDQLDRNSNRFEVIRKDTIYLKQENKKDEILTFFNDISVFSSDLRGIENYAFNGDNKDDVNKVPFCAQQRQMNVLKTVDLKRRAQDIINFFERV